MKKVIIITGAQATGKTHLANHLRETQGAKVFDDGFSPETTRRAIRKAINGELVVLVLQKINLAYALGFIERDTLTPIGVNIIDLDIVSYETV